LLASVLLVYWTAMFLLTWSQDREIQKERSLILDAYVNPILKRFERYEKEIAELGRNIYPDYKAIKNVVEAYRLQQQRTARATKLGRVIRLLEVVVPIALATIAAIVLARWVYVAL